MLPSLLSFCKRLVHFLNFTYSSSGPNAGCLPAVLRLRAVSASSLPSAAATTRQQTVSSQAPLLPHPCLTHGTGWKQQPACRIATGCEDLPPVKSTEANQDVELTAVRRRASDLVFGLDSTDSSMLCCFMLCVHSYHLVLV